MRTTTTATGDSSRVTTVCLLSGKGVGVMHRGCGRESCGETWIQRKRLRLNSVWERAAMAVVGVEGGPSGLRQGPIAADWQHQRHQLASKHQMNGDVGGNWAYQKGKEGAVVEGVGKAKALCPT